MSADAVEAQHIRFREKDMQDFKVAFDLPPQSTASRKKQIIRESGWLFVEGEKKKETKKKNRRLLRPPLAESTRSAEPPKLLALHTPPFTSIIPHNCNWFVFYPRK